MLRCVYENKEYIHYKKGRVQLQINVFGSFLQISHKVSNSVCGDSSIYPVIYAHTSCFLTTKKHQALFFFQALSEEPEKPHSAIVLHGNIDFVISSSCSLGQ